MKQTRSVHVHGDADGLPRIICSLAGIGIAGKRLGIVRRAPGIVVGAPSVMDTLGTPVQGTKHPTPSRLSSPCLTCKELHPHFSNHQLKGASSPPCGRPGIYTRPVHKGCTVWMQCIMHIEILLHLRRVCLAGCSLYYAYC